MAGKFRTVDRRSDRRKRLQLGAIPYPIPGYYNFYLFFGLTNLIGIFVIYCSAAFIVKRVQLLEWVTIVVVFLCANFVEYICHRGPMHNQLHLIPKFLFKPHTLSHHEYFTHDAMSMDTSKEAYKVLFFFWDVFQFLGLISPVFFLAWYLINRNVAGLTLITLVGSFLLYEWMHLVYHAPERYKIDRIPLLGALKRNHQTHHNKELMNDYNFNITLPIWDVIVGTLYHQPKGNISTISHVS
ncbi:MAG: sterol desaturase family protein [Candidatus Poribacteria bacterium]|nr:sterol desaturase family protein [Candidatus Poribacteria bacterium]